jgi:hypothetical protein
MSWNLEIPPIFCRFCYPQNNPPFLADHFYVEKCRQELIPICSSCLAQETTPVLDPNMDIPAYEILSLENGYTTYIVQQVLRS